MSAAGPLGQLPTADPANYTPNVNDGEVDSIWQIGSRVVIGGTFTQVSNATSNGGATYARSRIASFNASTGVIDTAFAPVFNGNVTTVIPAADGTSMYVAGNFTTVNGVSRSRIARINLSNGSLLTSFNAGSISGNIRDMRLVGGQLYIGGVFTSVGGQQRQRLASLNPDTGAVTTKVNLAFAGTQNGGTTQVFKMEVTPAGDRLLVIGNFAQVGGQNRRQIAMIDLSTTPASLNGWQTDFYTSTCASAFDAYIRDLDIADDGSFAVVSTTGAYRANTSCDTIARFPVYSAQAGLQPDWIDYTGGDTSYAVQIRAGAGAVPREGIAALDVVNGLPFSWNPGRDRGVGVFDFHVTAAGLWAGSDTDRWGGETRRKLAFFPWSGGVTIPENLIASLPGEVWMLGRTSGNTTQQDEVRHRTYSGTGAPGTLTTTAGAEPWRNVRASFMVNDTLYTLLSDGTFQRRAFNGSFTAATTVEIYANNIVADAPNISGMFFDPQLERIYYTMSGNNSLFYRYFTPESHVIGATRFTATAGSLSPNRVRGMFLSGGNIWFADTNSGNLLRIGFSGGAVTGSASTVDSTSDWRARAMFLDGDPVAPPPVNTPPTASFTSNCTLLSCTFTSTSTDGDGTIASYAWNFGDGQTSTTGPSVTHPFGAAGTYTVTLSVTDDDGAPSASPASAPVTVTDAPAPAGIAYRTGSSSQSGNGTAAVQIPAAVQVGDQLVLIVTANVATTATTPAGWTLLGTRDDGTPDMRSWVYTRTAVAGTAGSTVTSTLGAVGKASTIVLAYSDAQVPTVLASSVMGASSTALATPATPVAQPGSVVVNYWSDKSASNSGWSVPGTVTARVGSVGSGSGRITAAAADVVVTAANWPGATANSTVAGTKGIGWSIVVPPSGGGGPVPNNPPTATFTSNCTNLTCTFTSTSTDGDGTIASYAWNFGDASTSTTGPTVSHSYATAATYTVTLTVTDGDGATSASPASAQVTVTNAPPPTGTVAFRAAASADSTGAAASVAVPAAVQPGDQLLLIVTANLATTASTPDGWTLLGTQQHGTPDMTAWVFTRTAIAGTAGSTVTSTLGSAQGKSSRLLVAYSGAAAPTVIASAVQGASSAALATPSVAVAANGSTVVSVWSDKTASATGWTLPGSVTSRATTVGTGSGRITAAIGDSPASAGSWAGATATSSLAGTKGIAWSVVPGDECHALATGRPRCVTRVHEKSIFLNRNHAHRPGQCNCPRRCPHRLTWKR
ncbi:MAG: PKD domain-containing protein [Actinobacteria bacterium]|nr:PKD domain-containing protein [Actinomycetota bacterium]